MRARDARGHVQNNKSKAIDYSEHADITMVSSPSTNIVNDDSTYNNAPINTVPLYHNKGGSNNYITLLDGGRDGNPPYVRGVQFRCRGEDLGSSDVVPPPANIEAREIRDWEGSTCHSAPLSQIHSKLVDGDKEGYPTFFLHSRQTKTYSEVTQNRKVHITKSKDHCWDVPLTILGNGTSITARDAGGYVKIGKLKATDCFEHPYINRISNPSTEIEEDEGTHIIAPTNTAQSIQKRGGPKIIQQWQMEEEMAIPHTPGEGNHVYHMALQDE